MALYPTMHNAMAHIAINTIAFHIMGIGLGALQNHFPWHGLALFLRVACGLLGALVGMLINV